jgi:hypothetical protein
MNCGFILPYSFGSVISVPPWLTPFDIARDGDARLRARPSKPNLRMPSHADFVAMSTDRQWVWGVTDFYQAVGAVFGRIGTVVVTSIAVIILLAPVAFAWIAMQQGRPALVLWSVLAAISWYLARPNFGFLDAFGRLVCLGIASLLARSGGKLHLEGGIVVVVVFFLGVLTKVVTMQLMQLRLRRSRAAFERLVAANLYVFERRGS